MGPKLQYKNGCGAAKGWNVLPVTAVHGSFSLSDPIPAPARTRRTPTLQQDQGDSPQISVAPMGAYQVSDYVAPSTSPDGADSILGSSEASSSTSQNSILPRKPLARRKLRFLKASESPIAAALQVHVAEQGHRFHESAKSLSRKRWQAVAMQQRKRQMCLVIGAAQLGKYAGFSCYRNAQTEAFEELFQQHDPAGWQAALERQSQLTQAQQAQRTVQKLPQPLQAKFESAMQLTGGGFEHMPNAKQQCSTAHQSLQADLLRLRHTNAGSQTGESACAVGQAVDSSAEALIGSTAAARNLEMDRTDSEEDAASFLAPSEAESLASDGAASDPAPSDEAASDFAPSEAASSASEDAPLDSAPSEATSTASQDARSDFAPSEAASTASEHAPLDSAPSEAASTASEDASSHLASSEAASTASDDAASHVASSEPSSTASDMSLSTVDTDTDGAVSSDSASEGSPSQSGESYTQEDIDQVLSYLTQRQNTAYGIPAERDAIRELDSAAQLGQNGGWEWHKMGAPDNVHIGTYCGIEFQLGCQIDRALMKNNSAIPAEIKNRMRHFKNHLPEQELVQVQCQLQLCGASHGVLIERLEGDSGAQARWHEIHRDDHYWNTRVMPHLYAFVQVFARMATESDGAQLSRYLDARMEGRHASFLRKLIRKQL